MKNTQIILENISNKKAWFFLILYISLMIILASALGQFVDKEWLQSTVSNYGSLGIVIFLFIEYSYIIFVPVYNTTIHLAAGYIFGGNLGWLLNFLATTAGLFTIILLVKRFGRPLVEKILSNETLTKYDKISEKIGPLTLFAVYVLPLFPDDEITYLIAASRTSFARFILPVLLGNITKSAVSYIGDEGTGGISLALASRVGVFVVGTILIGCQEYFFNPDHKK